MASDLKGARWALWRNPEDLSDRQRGQLADIARTNRPLYRGYLLKEQLRQVFHLPHRRALEMLRRWLSWARRCRLAPFVHLAKTIKTHLTAIEAALQHRLSNARAEAINTRIRLITRVAFGFRSSGALVGLAMLSLGGLCPLLPGRP